jgi:hypothetical protein
MWFCLQPTKKHEDIDTGCNQLKMFAQNFLAGATRVLIFGYHLLSFLFR